MIPTLNTTSVPGSAEPPGTTSPIDAHANEPATEDIARLAYKKYSARNFADGHHLADWNAAEAELRALSRL